MTDTLFDKMEFDLVYEVDGDRNMTISDAYHYVPTVEHDPGGDILIDGLENGDGRQDWFALTGYTGQYSYSGAVMHSSERGGWHMQRDILDNPGLYVMVVVEVNCGNHTKSMSPITGDVKCSCGYFYCEDEPCNPDGETCECEPEGWTVLHIPAEDD